MKNRYLAGALFAALLSLTACSNENDPEMAAGTGHLSMSVTLDNDVITARGSRAEYSDVTADDLTVRLVSKTTGATVAEGPVAEFTAAEGKSVKAGKYTVEAFYGSAETDGFENPYFYGSADVEVVENQVAKLDEPLVAALQNSMVSVVYTDAFKNYFTDYSAKIVSAAARTTEYTATETRPAYIAVGDASVLVSVTKPNGLSAELKVAEFEAKAKHHYVLTVDVNTDGGGAGAPTLKLSFDDLVAQEDITIELTDELMLSPAPTIKLGAYTPDENGEVAISVVEGEDAPASLALSITALGGLREVNMTTSSSTLTSRGWPSGTVNILDAAVQAPMEALGFTGRGLWKNPDKMAVADFTGIVKNMAYAGDGVNRITISAVDKIGKVCDPITLVINVTKMEVRLSEGFAKEGASTLSASLYYPGNDVTSNVSMQMLTTRGTWDNAPYTAAPASRASRSGEYNYIVTVTILADAKEPYQLRAVGKTNTSLVSDPITIVPQENEFAINVAANDVWAKWATVKVTSKSAALSDAEAAAAATFQVSTDGGSSWTNVSAEKNGANVKLTGLNAATAYKVRGYLGGNPGRDCTPIELTTETAAQIPNGDMETWSVGNSGSNWKCYYPGADASSSVWGTNNPMTTSQGSDIAYCRSTNTQPTSDKHGGSSAAWIRTQGWGSGNTSATWSTCKMKYGDAGLLHLGSSRSSRPSGYDGCEGALTTDDLTCGLAFASRPSSISFWYKYTPKNGSDKGQVEYWIKDTTGAVIASGTQNLGSASAYTQVTLPISYVAGAKKAGSIYVKFLSSNDRSFLSKSQNNYERPPAFNLSDGEYLGSQLYIDDIILNY